MKRNLSFIFPALVILLFSLGCSEKDDDNMTEPEIILAYSLDQFVPIEAVSDLIVHDDEDNEEWRQLFNFWPVANDGFSPRSRSYDDLNWDNWQQGYYIPEDDNKIKFPQFEPLNIGAYNVKFMDQVYVFRGVEVIFDTMSVLCELNAMDTELIENYDGVQEDAIPLSSFIPEHFSVVDSVAFTAVDGYSKTYSNEQINDGYWLLDTQKTIFPNLTLPNSMKKFKWLMTMEVYGTWQNIEDYENPNLAEEAEADWNFSFPDDLSEYESIVWE